MHIPDPLVLIGGGLVYLLMIVSIVGLLIIGVMAFDAPNASKKSHRSWFLVGLLLSLFWALLDYSH